jgi:ABC-type polysaccharide/polyol phosphate transport system ATPase subunit
MSENSATKPSIEFRDVTLHYRIMEEQGINSFKEWAIKWITRRVRYRELVALRDVNFTLPPGGSIGVIGHNGAGKSTLLRVAAGILRPSRGTAVIRGRLAPILELGFGFEPELSGRENIFFNGALLGRSPAEMKDRMDEIVEFADLHEFIDQPLRTYSTGMAARLAFSVATTVDAKILLLDEVFAVGDAGFYLKCEQRIKAYQESGVSVLLVSHDLAAVEMLCDNALWLDKGRVRGFGKPSEIIPQYHASLDQGATVGGAIEAVATKE